MNKKYISDNNIAVGDKYQDASGQTNLTVVDVITYADRGDVEVKRDGWSEPYRIDAWKLHACRYSRVNK